MTEMRVVQLPLEFDVSPQPTSWDDEVTRHALDELFTFARQYRSSRAYHDLLQFVARFRFYSPFNALLVHVQMPGAAFVAPAHRWQREYGRVIKAGARPLVILQPRGPVMFVFDVSDVEPGRGARPLPPEIEKPFEVRKGIIGPELKRTIQNAKRDGVLVAFRQAGSQSAGQIGPAEPREPQSFLARSSPAEEWVKIPVRYELLLNAHHSPEASYATLAHELGHLYCGHLGTPDDKWWPDRRGLPSDLRELEAESVSYLVCGRLGIDSPSESYVASILKKDGEIPPISLELVMKAAGLIEQMGREPMRLRKKA